MSNKAENIAEAVGQLIGFGLLAGAIAFGVSACSGKKEEPKAAVSPTTVVNTAPVVEAPKAAPAVVQKVKSNWRYGENVDKMSGEVTKWAMTDSTNKVKMDFPHNGGSEGTIVVFEKNVKIHISKGQVMCSNYSGCIIKVKFDDEQPANYAAVGPANGQYDHIYLGYLADGNGAKKFMQKLKTAKTVMISLEVYQENSPVWEFNVAGFDKK
jgi:hypothetical protein